MGCDIHFNVERHCDPYGWIGIYSTESDLNFGRERRDNNPLTSRDYDFFGKIAGVRRDGPGAKGLPDDASDMSRFAHERWGMDGHSWTYLSLEEFLTIYVLHNFTSEVMRARLEHADKEKIFQDYFPHLWLSSAFCDYRVVIWFDN